MTKRDVLGGLLFVALLLGPGEAAAGEKPALALGDKVPNRTSPRDLRGNRRALHDFKNNKAIVLVFLGAECPVSNLYAPGLIALEKKYRPKQVQFLAIYPNEHEDLDRIARHSYD